MFLNFIIDTQLPPKLTKFFKELGHDCLHTTDFENGHLMDDLTIREIAIAQNRIVVTKDKDFRDHFILKGAPPKILLLSIGNCTNEDLFTAIKCALPICISNINHGDLFLIGSENTVAIF